jgi:hypothetical protein
VELEGLETTREEPVDQFGESSRRRILTRRITLLHPPGDDVEVRARK